MHSRDAWGNSGYLIFYLLSVFVCIIFLHYQILFKTLMVCVASDFYNLNLNIFFKQNLQYSKIIGYVAILIIVTLNEISNRPFGKKSPHLRILLSIYASKQDLWYWSETNPRELFLFRLGDSMVNRVHCIRTEC